ncbi:hypothetical protein SASPL_139395 [Salvia splendens]|uniref:Pto-interacting protein 1 n=1 Tax=Salvia splendens TaxID=180675 RepID=A0A8X8WNB2_SALSN|nr:hypothetical protein SASPL_139395 [Salvia splendens]
MDPRIHVTIHNSNSRISLFDISDPASPLSLSDLSNSKFSSNLHIFTHSELRLMTSDFSSVNFLGEGGFGPVHKGFVDDKCRPGLAPQPVAVKLLDPDGDQGHREWLNLVDWAKPYLKDHHKLESIIDQRLEGQYSSDGARKVAALAHQCLSHSPKTRPTMSHVVMILELIAQLRDTPFVYIAPAQGRVDAEIKEDEEEDEDEGKTKKEAGRKQRKRGYRHKHPIPIRAHGVYTDTHLYRAFKNEMIGVRIEGR